VELAAAAAAVQIQEQAPCILEGKFVLNAQKKNFTDAPLPEVGKDWDCLETTATVIVPASAS